MSEKLLQHTGEEVMFQISTNHRTFSDEGVDDGTSIKWENRSPSFAVEIDFGKPSSGFGCTFLIEPQSKVYNKLIHYPKDNESTIVKGTIRIIGVPIFYTWGDPELGKNGSWAFRAGVGPSIRYYDPLIIKYKDIEIIKKGFSPVNYSWYFSYDWGYFSFLAQNNIGESIKLDKLKNNNGKSIDFKQSVNKGLLNYSYYF